MHDIIPLNARYALNSCEYNIPVVGDIVTIFNKSSKSNHIKTLTCRINHIDDDCVSCIITDVDVTIDDDLLSEKMHGGYTFEEVDTYHLCYEQMEGKIYLECNDLYLSDGVLYRKIYYDDLTHTEKYERYSCKVCDHNPIGSERIFMRTY